MNFTNYNSANYISTRRQAPYLIVAVGLSWLLGLGVASPTQAVPTAQPEALFVISSSSAHIPPPEIDPPSNLWRIDPSTGAVTLVSALESRHQSLATSPDGTLYGWVGNGAGLVTIDKFTGAETDVNPNVDSGPGFGLSFQSLTFAPDGRLFGMADVRDGGNSFNSLYTIDTETAVASLVGSSPESLLGHQSVRGIAFIDDRLVGVAFSFDDSLFFDIDANDGSISGIKPTGTPRLNSLAENNFGELFSVGGSDESPTVMVTLDPTTGATLSSVFIDLPVRPELRETVRAISFAPVPEPGTLGLALLMLVVGMLPRSNPLTSRLRLK